MLTIKLTQGIKVFIIQPMKAESPPAKVNPRQLLIEELERRCRENPRYSLRAFARALGISPSALSLIMAGRRGLSRKLAEAVCQKLALNPEVTSSFIQNALKRGQASKVDLAHFSQLSLDQFATISEWYHFAILSLIETKDFKPNVSWIASRLEISVAEVRAATERLQRLGILETSGLRWRQVGAPIFLNNSESTAGTKKFQRQVLEKAIFSLENDPAEVRELNSVTIAISPQQVIKAKKQIRKFLVGLMTELEKEGQPSEVYHLSLQLCPVSKNRGN